MNERRIVEVLPGRFHPLVQPFLSGSPPAARSEPERCTSSALRQRLAAGSERLVGHAAENADARTQTASGRFSGAGPLAPTLLRLAPTVAAWRWQELTEPLYLRSPSVTLPREKGTKP